ncbi:MAG TPA: DUF255 domain-containing protein [Saprospiraceae bacterium]|nr:DUF255 domain-containing protein [Saprospiraceae bacterium]HMQ82410.1 DUF255 domain-containing protein [Saprospiraceae bacterium]
MTKKAFFGIGLLALAIGIYSFTTLKPSAAESKEAEKIAESITWYSWDQGIALMEKQPKKMFIDVYTDWCGYCKKMDRETFQDPKVIKYMNDNFYAVKFDAEQKEDIEYKGHKLSYVAGGRRGVHQLAYSLLEGRLGYPSFVYLDEAQNRISISPGYKTPEMMLEELEYIAQEKYKE